LVYSKPPIFLGRVVRIFWDEPFFFTFRKNLKKKIMAKGEDKRKEDKKKPVKTLKEKRAEKRAKKG
jgi:hypothetical protein